MAKNLADAYKLDPTEPDPKKDFAQIIADLRDAALDLRALRTDDADIAVVAKEGSGAFADGAARLERLDALPKPPGEVDWFAENVVRGYLLDVVGIFQRVGEVQGQQDALVSQVRGLVAASKRGDAAKLMLPRIAAKYSGPRVTVGQAVLIDLDAAWGPAGPDDWLTLSNSSGLDLSNATVLVELRGQSGDVVRNVHFVPSWRAGAAIYAKYSGGKEVLGERVDRGTVPLVESVVVSLWADELSQEGIAYGYSGSERDQDVARYCKDLRVVATYRPFEGGVLWNTERGVLVRLQGVRYVDNPRITARFFRGAETLSWYWDFPRWDEGEQKTLDAGGRLPWDPERFTVEVTFPETGYKNETNWSVK